MPLTTLLWVQTFSMKPHAPADDGRATEYLNRNARVQMGIIKERLEARPVRGKQITNASAPSTMRGTDGGPLLPIQAGGGDDPTCCRSWSTGSTRL